MKTALIMLLKDIGAKAVEALRPVVARKSARRSWKFRKQAEMEQAEEEEIFQGGA